MQDLGTGIQPFLTPVPPLESDTLAKATLPIRYIVGIFRTALLLFLLATYIVFVSGFCTIFAPIPPLFRFISSILTSIITRLALLVLGLVWIPTAQVSRKRGKAQTQRESWSPGPGDIIVSNWVSYIELLWLAFRFNPIFVLPISESFYVSAASHNSNTISHTPGRRGTGSANVPTPRKTTPVVPIVGFLPVPLLSIIRLTGQVPSAWRPIATAPHRSLEELRQSADRPIVLFPECTTSNGRGLLRFAKVLHEKVSAKKYQVFVMCVRYDPPSTLSPTLTLSIPSASLNPLPHIFSLATSISLPTVSIRLLVPSESPRSPLFPTSEVIADTGNPDNNLTEACAAIITQIGKMKSIGMGWEDKTSFLDFLGAKRK